MDYLKINHLSIIIIVWLVLSPFLGGSGMLGALERTTVGNPWTFNGAVTFSSTVTNSSTVANNGLVTNNAGTLRSHTVATSTSGTATTLKVSDVNGYDTISVTPNTSTLTYTFFASSTASTWLPTAGDMQETCFLNATTTAGVNLVFAGGTGIDMQVATSTNNGGGAYDLTISPNATGCFKFIRKAATASAFDIEANLVEYSDGD